MKFEFGRSLIEKRFGSVSGLSEKLEKKVKKQKKLDLSKNIKVVLNKDSVTEYSAVERLSEILYINNKNICNKKSTANNWIISTNNTNTDTDTISIPPRVPYTHTSKEEYKKLEMTSFNKWKKTYFHFIFERNIEIWRQFWITCERSDVIVQIVDARNPSFFFNEDIIKMYRNKKHVVFCNKSDLSKNIWSYKGCEVVRYSATSNIQVVVDYLSNLKYTNIGFIGYPNVGKSSTINGILNRKKVKVSQTPGKTKYIQTIQYTEDKVLLDCPGLVFPKHHKTQLLLHGILNVDKVLDLRLSVYEVISYIGIDKLVSYYKIPYINTTSEVVFIEYMSTYKNMSVSDCIKVIVKDLFSGNIQY